MALLVDIKKKLNGFNLDIGFETGEGVLGILGQSGCGKSMTLRCIAGIDIPDSGRIILNGRTLFDSEKGINLPARDRRIGFLFQNYALFPHMTVEQNIGFALETLPPGERMAKVHDKITMMKLGGLENRYPSQLSGGQQQRAALARALAIDPEILLLDEPFSALDEYLRSQMVQQLTELLYEYKGAALFVTHSVEEAYQVCNELIIMNNGRKEAYGNKAELLHNPPSLVAAQVTGCKNISLARVCSKNIVEAVEWGIQLQVEKAIEEISYVGIRANHIRLEEDSEAVNAFDCWPAYTSEMPHRIRIYLCIKKPAAATRDYELVWEVSRDKWMEIKERPLPWRICLRCEKLITIK
jgi:molybdate transport system ATP-binding protein